MAAIPDTPHKESLQALALAVRQAKGSAVTNSELRNAMRNMDTIDSLWPRWPYGNRVSEYFRIPNSMNRDFAEWVRTGNQLDMWVDSSRWAANAVANGLGLGRIFCFVQSAELSQFREAYRAIAKDVRDTAQSPTVRAVFREMSGGTGDKWNPADIFAIRPSLLSTISNHIESYVVRNTRGQVIGNNRKVGGNKFRKFQEQNIKLQQKMNAQGKKNLSFVEDMAELYYYNKFVDDLYTRRIFVPISLKKVGWAGAPIPYTSPTVRIKWMDHQGSKALEEALDFEVKIDKIDWKENAQKCIVEFTVMGDSGWKLDIRSFQTPITDNQMQLQHGTQAGHGKIVLPVFSLITHLTKGTRAFLAQKKKKRDLFKDFGSDGKFGSPGNMKFPIAPARHDFTSWDIFRRYAQNSGRGPFSRDTLEASTPVESHSKYWIEYIEWLSNNNHHRDRIGDSYRSELGTGRQLNYTKGAKYLKNKVQAYEVGMILDQSRNEIGDIIKENIMKSVYSQAASKGFRIFGDNQITEYMTSSSYLKVGG